MYATLKVTDNGYILFDSRGKAILTESLPKINYIYEKSIVFNRLAEYGWSVVFPLKSEGWFMMKETNKT
jgi:hypothetical protein